MTQLVYIHGFNSSPQSYKAQLLVKAMSARGQASAIHVPALPFDPAAAMNQLQQLLERLPMPVALIGSSLGGFYATRLSAQFNCKTALINPVVAPWKQLAGYLGVNENFHTGERYEFGEQHVQMLQRYDEVAFDTTNLLVLLQTGDETLNWQDAWKKYQQCSLYKELGGSHGFDNFGDYLPLIFRFLGIE